MVKTDTNIDELRERLTSALADWGTEMSAVLSELDGKRSQLQETRANADQHTDELKALNEKVQGQQVLIKTLKDEAEEASELRSEVRSKDLEIERQGSELDSKQELILSLRREAEGLERLMGDARLKDDEIEQLKKERRQTEHRVAELLEEIDVLSESSQDQASGEQAELEAVRAELDARKTLIRSLRADAERVNALAMQLEEKREIIETLEASMNRHANTIVELRRGADVWKRKYQALSESRKDSTSKELPIFTATDVRELEQLDAASDTAAENTIAIDMRQPLREARDTADRSRVKEKTAG